MELDNLRDQLTDMEKIFCDNYFACLNITEAYLRVREDKEITRDSACNAGHRLLNKPHVARYIEARNDQIKDKTGITKKLLVNQLMRIAFSDLNESLIENGGLDSQVVSEIMVSRGREGTTRKVKTYDKIKAIDLLGKHLGLWKDAIDINLTTIDPEDVLRDLTEKINVAKKTGDDKAGA